MKVNCINVVIMIVASAVCVGTLTIREKYEKSSFSTLIGISPGTVVTFESSNFQGQFIRHKNFEAWRDLDDKSDLFKKDSTFTVRAANDGKVGYISLESINFPNHFLRHQNFLLMLHKSDKSKLFNEDSSFRIVQARNGKPKHVSLESSNFPNYFIRHSRGRIRIDQAVNDQLYNDDSSWKVPDEVNNNSLQSQPVAPPQTQNDSKTIKNSHFDCE